MANWAIKLFTSAWSFMMVISQTGAPNLEGVRMKIRKPWRNRLRGLLKVLLILAILAVAIFFGYMAWGWNAASERTPPAGQEPEGVQFAAESAGWKTRQLPLSESTADTLRVTPSGSDRLAVPEETGFGWKPLGGDSVHYFIHVVETGEKFPCLGTRCEGPELKPREAYFSAQEGELQLVYWFPLPT